MGQREAIAAAGGVAPRPRRSDEATSTKQRQRKSDNISASKHINQYTCEETYQRAIPTDGRKTRLSKAQADTKGEGRGIRDAEGKMTAGRRGEPRPRPLCHGLANGRNDGQGSPRPGRGGRPPAAGSLWPRQTRDVGGAWWPAEGRLQAEAPAGARLGRVRPRPPAGPPVAAPADRGCRWRGLSPAAAPAGGRAGGRADLGERRRQLAGRSAVSGTAADGPPVALSEAGPAQNGQDKR